MNINKLIYGPNMAGQSLVDRVMAAKHSLAGQGLAKSVCKATTEEVIPPKKKHVDYLVQCTNEPNVSIPQLAGLLLERSQNFSWVSVYKALLTTHSLMNHGNERFTQYLASNNCSFKLENFTDKSSPQGYDMSPYIRRYAKYLNEKAFTYRQMAFDFCKIKKGKDDGVMRIMETDKLLKALPVLQGQVDALLDFEVTPSEMNNPVIFASFMMLFKDLIRLLACYNDAIINLLAKFFEMNRKQCKEAFDLYKKFVVRMEGVGKFFQVAESVGIEKGDIPDLAQAPSTLLDALETHMKSLESSKKGSTRTQALVDSAISDFTAVANKSASADTEEFNYFTDASLAAAGVVGDQEVTGAVQVSSNNPFADFGDINDTDDSPPADAVDATAVKKNPFLTGDFAAVDAEEDPWSDQPNANANNAGLNFAAAGDDFNAAFDQAFSTANQADDSSAFTVPVDDNVATAFSEIVVEGNQFEEQTIGEADVALEIVPDVQAIQLTENQIVDVDPFADLFSK